MDMFAEIDAGTDQCPRCGDECDCPLDEAPEIVRLRAEVARLETNRVALRAQISELSRGWRDVCCTLRPGHDRSHRSVDQHERPSRWVTIHATEEHADEQVAAELSEMATRAETAEAQVARVRAVLDQPCVCQAPKMLGHDSTCPVMVVLTRVVRAALDDKPGPT